MPITQTRRRLLTTLSMFGAAGLVRAPRALAAEGALETTSVRLSNGRGICVSPQWIAEELLRAEGFTDIRYVEIPAGAVPVATGRSEIDFTMNYATTLADAIDRGEAIIVLAGVHVGCFELFGNEGIRSITDLKGKTVGVQALGHSDHLFVSVMAAHVGLDPVNEIHWITSQSPTPAELFVDGRIDACLGTPPVAQDLRARHIGRVVVNSAWTVRGRNIFAACCTATAALSKNTRSRQSARCARSSRLRKSAPPIRRASRGSSSTAVSPTDMTMRCRRSASCLTTNGANTIPRTL